MTAPTPGTRRAYGSDAGPVRRFLKHLRVRQKNFSGNIFDRLRGLDYVLARCAGCSVLDIGCNEGLIAYEFARNGIRIVHGFERDGHRVNFATRLFRDVPVESRFIRANLAKPGFEGQYGSLLREQYDIVLFLGVYHHLRRQMPTEDLRELVTFLVDRAGEWFVDRGKALPEYESTLLSRGFRLVHSSPGHKGKGGSLHVYSKGSPGASE